MQATVQTLEPQTVVATATLCPVCGCSRRQPRWSVRDVGAECGVDAGLLAPSSTARGRALGTVVFCDECSHGSTVGSPAPAVLAAAYAAAVDVVSLREEPGQVETAARLLGVTERWITPGAVLDVGCWTGSLLVAARRRGWTGIGLEPSVWAAARARMRGVEVLETTIEALPPDVGPFNLVSLCDVLEHLVDPAAALRAVHEILAGDGGVVITVPDAGSALARMLGPRWWSVLPMHLQYFTRSSLHRLLDRAGFDVVWSGRHPKVFSTRYYAERAASLSPAAGRLLERALSFAGRDDRLVAPDLRDRMAMVALKRLGGG